MNSRQTKRRDFMQTMGFGAASMALANRSSASDSSSKQRPPNILLIVSDDQGYNDLGCYGSAEIKTPHLDKLASEGIRLTSFYVTWPACTPSRGSLLTGRYPQRNGTYDMFRNDKVDYGYKYPPEEYAISPERILGMDTREVLLPKVLKKAGYVSGIFGKWDLGQLHRFLPLQRGFDEFYGFVNTGIDYWTHERYGAPSMYRNNQPTTEDKGTYCTDLFKREALRFIEENKDQPFFCYVPFNAPHIASVLEKPKPVQAPQKYIDMYPKPQNRREEAKTQHMAAVTCMDDAIGELLASLEKHNLTGNTIVIFFSDNGGSGTADNTPLRGGKSRMFEGGLRVPCIVKWPEKVRRNEVCDEFLSSLEIFPMLCNVAGAKPPEDVILDGFDMTPVLSKNKPSQRQQMFWKRRADKAARVGNWKWVDSSRGSGLFNLENDISEQNDLSEERPDMLKKLKDRFDDWMARMEKAEPRRPFRDF